MDIAVCDDEEFQRDIICGYITPFISKYKDMSVVRYDSGEALVEEYKNKKYDIIFLDINMKEIDGIQTAKEIRKHDNNVIIIFITSFTKFISMAFTVKAFQFLVKPLSKESFNTEFERAIEQYNMNHYKYILKWESKMIVVELADVVYVEQYQRRLHICTKDGRVYNASGRIKEQEEKLYLHGFVRVHQGYLVNMAYIRSIYDREIMTTIDTVVPISMRRKKYLLNEFNKYLSGCGV